MVGLGRFITAAVTLGCATLAAGQATYSPAALTGALAGLALRLEDLYFRVADVPLPGQAPRIDATVSELNNISATNGNPFAVERTFTQAEQYGFLNAVYALAYSEKFLIHEAAVRRAYFASANATAAWQAFFQSVREARANLDGGVDGYAPEVASSVKSISASIILAVDLASEAYS